MKKTIFIFSMILILILGNTVATFADAIAYDMEKAGYYVYVATPDGGLNMRYGPGTEYDRVMDGRIPDNVRLYIGYTSGNWGYTSYNGYEGWVALRQTTTTPPVVRETPVQEEVEEPIAEQPTEQTTIEPVQEEKVQETNQENLEKTEDSEIVKGAMLHQIILIAAILILVIIIAVLVLIIINLKAKK